ncbi:hypothetical protein Jiend_47810 [Micromonospora endophytica]|nr:hypothetical protein Jiend_47810 [Micromonospora endophytica]
MTADTPLAHRQAQLVAALVTGATPPPGFAPGPLAAARAALLRKRAGEAARHWPLLAAGLGPRWPATFTEWAAGRPNPGGLRDGWDLARALQARAALPRWPPRNWPPARSSSATTATTPTPPPSLAFSERRGPLLTPGAGKGPLLNTPRRGGRPPAGYGLTPPGAPGGRRPG